MTEIISGKQFHVEEEYSLEPLPFDSMLIIAHKYKVLLTIKDLHRLENEEVSEREFMRLIKSQVRDNGVL